MKLKYISQEKLEVLRKFLETRDLSKLPIGLQYIMWRANDLYATSNTPQVYLTKSKNYTKDLMVQFNEKGEVISFIISDDYSGSFWSIK